MGQGPNLPQLPTISELKGSPRETFTTGGVLVAAERDIQTAWPERAEVIAILGGGKYPHDPKLLAVSVTDVRGTGKSFAEKGNPQVIGYPTARFTIAYRLPADQFPPDDPPVDPEIVRTESLEPAAEFVTVSRDDLFWTAGDVSERLEIDEAPGVLIRMADWVVKFTNVASPLAAAITFLTGTVNNSPLSSALHGWSFPVETLLYNPPTIDSTLFSDGSVLNDVTVRFTFRPSGWNVFFRSGLTFAIPIFTFAGPQYKPYPLGDFSLLGI